MHRIRSNGAGATNPFRLDRSEAATADQDHDYTPEQLAFDHGLMDCFPGIGRHRRAAADRQRPSLATTGLTMGYYDGNTVTALWNYAQRYAHERQLLRHQLRSLHRWRDQSDLRPDQRRHHGSSTRAAPRSATATAASRSSAMPIRSAMSARPPPASRSSSAARTSATF